MCVIPYPHPVHGRRCSTALATRELPPFSAQEAEEARPSCSGPALLRSYTLAFVARRNGVSDCRLLGCYTFDTGYFGGLGSSFSAGSRLAVQQNDGPHARSRRGFAARRRCSRDLSFELVDDTKALPLHIAVFFYGRILWPADGALDTDLSMLAALSKLAVVEAWAVADGRLDFTPCGGTCFLQRVCEFASVVALTPPCPAALALAHANLVPLEPHAVPPDMDSWWHVRMPLGSCALVRSDF